MRVLFIGNSHTYFNDMPHMFAQIAKDNGIECEVTMIAHGGWYLHQHLEELEVRFNILHGHYDYVVLQDHAHPFGPVSQMIDAAKGIAVWIREAGSIPVAYMTWESKGNEAAQHVMSNGYVQMAQEIGAVLAPVGDVWQRRRRECPETELYFTDGKHASPEGSRLAAEVLFDSIYNKR